MAQVGLKDLHFAILTADTKEELAYEAPEAVVGAINATINPEVGTQELYADDQLWELSLIHIQMCIRDRAYVKAGGEEDKKVLELG